LPALIWFSPGEVPPLPLHDQTVPWSFMALHLLYTFLANCFLIVLDAAIGYYAAPALVRLGGGEEADAEGAIRGMRRLLAGVVALYMFFNCLAFFDQKPWLLYLASAVLVTDIVVQLIICRKMMHRTKL